MPCRVSDHLGMMAMANVIEATVFIMEVTKVGDVYFKLEKYMFRVKLPLQILAFCTVLLSFPSTLTCIWERENETGKPDIMFLFLPQK